LKRRDANTGIVKAGQHADRRRFIRLAHPLKRFQTTTVGQREIQQDDVKRFGLIQISQTVAQIIGEGNRKLMIERIQQHLPEKSGIAGIILDE
jgi:hypothetical protein